MGVTTPFCQLLDGYLKQSCCQFLFSVSPIKLPNQISKMINKKKQSFTGRENLNICFSVNYCDITTILPIFLYLERRLGVMLGLSFPNIYLKTPILILFSNFCAKFITQVNVGYNLYQFQLLRLSVIFQLLIKTMNFYGALGSNLLKSK